MKTSNDKKIVELEKRRITAQITSEVKLLNQRDPDKELKEEFETASLHDLQKYSHAKRLL